MAQERPKDNAPPNSVKPEVLAVSFVQIMDRTEDAGVVQQSFQQIVETLGFTSATCGTLPATGQFDPTCVLMCTRPAGWADAYFEQGYAKHDPVLREIRRSRRAFAWPGGFGSRPLSRREREVLRQWAEFGMTFGLAVPIPEAGGNIGFVNIAGSQPCTDEKWQSALTLVSIYLYYKLRALAAAHRGPSKRLSPREREILHWISEGKSDWQIGRILAISAKTVNYHTENVKRKFGVATRMQAVVSAIQQGKLSP